MHAYGCVCVCVSVWSQVTVWEHGHLPGSNLCSDPSCLVSSTFTVNNITINTQISMSVFMYLSTSLHWFLPDSFCYFSYNASWYICMQNIKKWDTNTNELRLVVNWPVIQLGRELMAITLTMVSDTHSNFSIQISKCEVSTVAPDSTSNVQGPLYAHLISRLSYNKTKVHNLNYSCTVSCYCHVCRVL